MALVKVMELPNNFLRVPNETCKHPETEIPLESLGLLINICHYSGSWVIHKTELYKRFKKNKKTSVSNAWDSLVDANYIIEYKYRNGKQWEYIYYVRLLPFTEEEIKAIYDEAKQEYGEIFGLKLSTSENQKSKKISTSDFGKSKLDSSKSADNKYYTNEKQINEKQTEKEYSLELGFDVEESLPFDMVREIDDDKPSFQKDTLNEQDVKYIVEKLTLQFKEHLALKSINSVIRKVMNKYSKGQITDLQEYLFTSLNNKYIQIDKERYERKLRKAAEEDKHNESKEEYQPMGIPFYNWLEEKK